MARNMVQFRKGLGMVDFLKKYGSEDACREAVFKFRWPEGFRCPECGNSSYCEIKARQIFQCQRCHHQTSLHGTYKAVRGKQLVRYLGAFAYRFNRRFELGSMIERLAYVACRTAPLPYRFATMAEVHT
jgi:ribosomal protein L37AE/L43A